MKRRQASFFGTIMVSYLFISKLLNILFFPHPEEKSPQSLLTLRRNLLTLRRNLLRVSSGSPHGLLRVSSGSPQGLLTVRRFSPQGEETLRRFLLRVRRKPPLLRVQHAIINIK